MKLKNFTKKKAVAFGLAFGVAAGAGGIAAAYFTSSGTGSGTADVGGVHKALAISQIGAGYNSLVTSNGYLFSQCFTACSGLKQIGSRIHLTNTTTGYGQLTSATVALVNFGVAKTLTVDLYIETGPNGTYRFTTKAYLAGGTSTTQKVTTVHFTFAKKQVFADTTFTYGIELMGTTSGVNIALASAPTQVTVGSATGNTTLTGNGTTKLAPNNSLAGYVPAARFNIVGGVVPALFPNSPAQPIQYAITNPNAGRVYVSSITTGIDKTGTTSNATVIGALGCKAGWFNLASPTFTYNTDVAPGTTIITSAPTTLQLVTNGGNQNACENASVKLTLTSN